MTQDANRVEHCKLVTTIPGLNLNGSSTFHLGAAWLTQLMHVHNNTHAMFHKVQNYNTCESIVLSEMYSSSVEPRNLCSEYRKVDTFMGVKNTSLPAFLLLHLTDCLNVAVMVIPLETDHTLVRKSAHPSTVQ